MGRNSYLIYLAIARSEFDPKEKKTITIEPLVKLLPCWLVVPKTSREFVLHNMTWVDGPSHTPKSGIPLPCNIFAPHSGIEVRLDQWFGYEARLSKIALDVENAGDSKAFFDLVLKCETG